MKLVQALAAGLILLTVVAGSIALGSAVLMGFLAFANQAGFDVPAISFAQSVPIFVLGSILAGILGQSRR